MQMRHIDIAMKDNHCLRVAEIVQMVVDEVSGSADLAHLARASRSFQEPALNKLWKTVVGLEPLLRTLPTNLYEEVEVGATTAGGMTCNVHINKQSIT